MGDLLFVTGGARSGKSRFAEHLAGRSGRPVVYIATLEALDEEMRHRIGLHRARRPAGWSTVEAPRDLLGAVRGAPAVACVLIDCVSVWLSNRLLALGDEPASDDLEAFEQEVLAELDRLTEHQREHENTLITVSNEVGSGVVPPYPLGRAYRDALGRVNQRLSTAADRAWLVVAGRALELPEPFEA